MYFSRVKINSGSMDKIKLLIKLEKDVYAIHRLIWQLFPGQPEMSRDFLFRQEFESEQCPVAESSQEMPIFYVVSKRGPVPVPGLLSVLTKEYNPQLKIGMKLGFILRANPVVSRPQEGKKNSAKHDVLMDAKIRAKEANIPTKKIWDLMRQSAIDWLIRKSSDFGFKIIDNEGSLSVVPYSYRQHRLYIPKRRQEIKFSSIDFRGALMISNPESFYRALYEGIGRSKSFGCGLIMVRRI